MEALSGDLVGGGQRTNFDEQLMPGKEMEPVLWDAGVFGRCLKRVLDDGGSGLTMDIRGWDRVRAASGHKKTR